MRKNIILMAALMISLSACGSTSEPEKQITPEQVMKYEHKVNIEKESTISGDKQDENTGNHSGTAGEQQESIDSNTSTDSGNYTETGDRVYVAVSKLNLRTGPSTDTEVVVQVKYGDSFIRVAKGEDGWDQLMYEDRIVYAYSEYLTTEKIAGTASGNFVALVDESKKN